MSTDESKGPVDPFPDVEGDIRRLMDAQKKEAEARRAAETTKQQLLTDVRRDFREALDMKTEVLLGTSHAPRLSERHNRLNRSRQIADAILALERTNNITDTGRRYTEFKNAQVDFDTVRGIVDNNGAFLLFYGVPLMEDRLHGLPWIVTESRKAGSDLGGDCQIEMPSEDGLDSPIRLPDKAAGDHVWGENVVEAIRSGEAPAALLADFCADDTASHQRFAGNARYLGIRQILEANKARKKPVRYLVAETFSIRGLRTPSGDILLEKFGESPLSNRASFFTLTHSKRRGYAGTLEWLLRNHNMPVTIDGQECEFIADQLVIVNDLEKIARYENAA